MSIAEWPVPQYSLNISVLNNACTWLCLSKSTCRESLMERGVCLFHWPPVFNENPFVDGAIPLSRFFYLIWYIFISLCIFNACKIARRCFPSSPIRRPQINFNLRTCYLPDWSYISPFQLYGRIVSGSYACRVGSRSRKESFDTFKFRRHGVFSKNPGAPVRETPSWSKLHVFECGIWRWNGHPLLIA